MIIVPRLESIQERRIGYDGVSCGQCPRLAYRALHPSVLKDEQLIYIFSVLQHELTLQERIVRIQSPSLGDEGVRAGDDAVELAYPHMEVACSRTSDLTEHIDSRVVTLSCGDVYDVLPCRVGASPLNALVAILGC